MMTGDGLPKLGDLVLLTPEACQWLTRPVPFRVMEARPGVAGWAYLTGWITELSDENAMIQQTVHVELARLRRMVDQR